MGDDHKLDAVLYSIDGSTGEMKPLGKLIEIPKLSPGGIVNEKISDVGETREIVIPLNPKTITKKRFVKLLMGRGYQRNEANKMHQEYMSLNKIRTKIGLIFFEIFYDVEPKFKLQIEGRELDVDCIKTNNM